MRSNKLITIGLVLFLIICFSRGYIYEDCTYDIMRTTRDIFIDDFMNFIDFTAKRVRTEIERNPYYIRIRGGHLNHSRSMILKAAELSLARQDGNSVKRALVIGAGNCLDIPLKELVNMFDEVYLLDLAHKTVRNIKETGFYYELVDTGNDWQVQGNYLSVEERAKIKIALSDVTGGAILEIASRTRDLIGTSSITKDDVLTITEGTTLGQLPFEDGYFDFISSSTVLAGIVSKIEGYMKSRLHNADAAFYVSSIKMQEILQELNRRVEEHHMAESNRLLKQTGRFYLSASRFMCQVYCSGRPGKESDFLKESEYIYSSSKGINMPDDLGELAADYFYMNPEEQDFLNLWLWPIGTDENGQDRAIAVQAVILSKDNPL